MGKMKEIHITACELGIDPQEYWESMRGYSDDNRKEQRENELLKQWVRDAETCDTVVAQQEHTSHPLEKKCTSLDQVDQSSW